MPSCHSVHDLELAVQDLWAHLPQGQDIRVLLINLNAGNSIYATLFQTKLELAPADGDRLLSCFWISTIILLDEEIHLVESKEERESIQMRHSGDDTHILLSDPFNGEI
ncbi:hypothetical protein TNCV_915551 [Trichonephila clavipes]|nr:hypothetical protein TNCV_915551 [Trichonephila clavipes]